MTVSTAGESRLWRMLKCGINQKTDAFKGLRKWIHLNTGVDLLWAYNTSTSHIESYAKYDCLAKGLPLGSKCRRCLDSSDGGKNLGVWDCKTQRLPNRQIRYSISRTKGLESVIMQLGFA